MLKHNERTESTVSASKERKEELELERKRQREEEAKKDRRSMRLYGLVAAVVAVLAVALMVFNSGLLQRSTAAITVNGTEYSAADLQYYYNMEFQNVATYAMYGMYDFDYTADPADQIYDEATGQTWEEYLVECAKEYATNLTAMADAAKAAGHTLSEEGRQTIDTVLANVDAAWIGSYNSRDAYLRAAYGPYMTYDRFVELVELEVMASDYANTVAAALEYTQEDYEAYYAENADTLDSFTLTQYVLQAKADVAEDATEEESAAALEQAKAEKAAVAKEIQDKLNAGEDAQALADEYADEVFTSSVSLKRSGDSVAGTSYAEWAVDAGRKVGDTTIAEYEGYGVYNYYVVRFEGRELDQANTADIRQILIAAAESGVVPTDEQYDEAKAKAEELLAGWDGTEEGFATLAVANSADPSSASNGGLMTGVSGSDGYVQPFTDWCLDPARKAGDTGIVKNEGSSTMGWHIMYYVGEGMPEWQLSADDALRKAGYNAWRDEVTQGYEAVEGFGMKLM